MFDSMFFAVLGGALALIGGLVGSTIGIAKAASAGTATLSEDSGQFRNVIVLASMPMTQTFYGLIIMILIVTAVVPNVEAGASGVAVFGIGLIGALAELFSQQRHKLPPGRKPRANCKGPINEPTQSNLENQLW